MKKNLLTLIILVSMTSISWSQTTVLDFEAPSTSTTFQYFGSAIDGQLNAIIDNPNASGINTSAKVAEYIKPADAQTWAGAFSNPNPSIPVDLTSNTQICIKVHMDHIGNLALKFEGSTTGGDNWLTTQANTLTNEWEEICFDANDASEETPFTPAAGNVYATVVLFFDFGTDGAGSAATSYFDDIVINPVAQTCSTVLDFEDNDQSTTFQYFGSSIDGTLSSVIDNPNASGINTSAKVLEFVKPGDAQTWAGAFSNPNPTIPVDLTSANQVCMKVHFDHPGNVALKLENSTTGDNWVQTLENSTVDAWEEFCFDTTLPSLEDPFTAAAGHVYSTITLFVDFNIAGTGSDVTTYLDDFCLLGGGGSGPADITFSVDMNDYSGSFTSVNVSGTFNNWSGDANPLTDPDMDGVYTGTITIPTGAHEYKFTLDNWTAQEEFSGLETCTVKDPSGQFTNRLLVVTQDNTLPDVCFNSCYACGNSITISFQLGMGAIVADTSGVYLAGGGNFDVPGGKYRLNDDDMDDIYTISFEREKGFSSYYTFANGNCPDYSCKEDISGQSCANSDNFNDRLLPAVTQDTVIATCFALCATNTDCTVGTKDIDIVNDLFTVSPNPVNNFANITFTDTSNEDRLLKVYDLRGQLLFTAILDIYSGQYELNTSQFNSGIYLITVQEGNILASRKIIKQ